ncbi:MAG: cobalamin biosynthesis protein CobW [Aestuariivita sp.]|nr:cobalamin biosynthesis protein CobW [Aestuariivita sp.]
MPEFAKLPVTVVTGFLGSGKTTLIQNLMRNTSGKRLAIIVNEFGDVGVDGDILKNCAIPNCPAENIVELANGCICCTVADDFILTIETLMGLNPQPDHILIETSGLALPKPLLKAFDWPDIRSRITVDGVIALADAEAVADGRFAANVTAVEAQRETYESIDHETPLSEVFEDQMACADLVLLTKPDLATPDDIAKSKAYILDVSGSPVPIIEVTEGDVNPFVVLGLEAAAEDSIAARKSHHDGLDEHDHEDFATLVIDLPELHDPDELVTTIKALAKNQNILRIKGFASVSDKPMRLLIQAVGTRVRHQYDRPWKPDELRQGRLVIIGEHDNFNTDKLKSVFRMNKKEAAE